MQAARASFDRQCITEQNLPRDLKRDLLNTYKAPTSTTEDTQIEKENIDEEMADVQQERPSTPVIFF